MMKKLILLGLLIASGQAMAVMKLIVVTAIPTILSHCQLSYLCNADAILLHDDYRHH